MATKEQAELSATLTALAHAMEQRPAPIIGVKVNMNVGPGAGSAQESAST
jgi:hypothetical protein